MAHAANKSAVEVVVVEDDPTFLSFWKRFLEAMGVSDFMLIANPFEAKEVLCRVSCKLLISDINMRGINGYELAKLACDFNPACSVILTTAYGANLKRFDLKNCAFHLLFKPYNDIGELNKLVKHLLKGENSFDDLSEDSWSENEDYPQVIEWKL
ncbi:MAG: response regulator [Proteobacteria bacterium]|nr:response regulator [Pseudomonadota bacterium]